MKNVFKTGFFYFMSLVMLVGSSGLQVSLGSFNNLAHAEEIGVEKSNAPDKYTICHATGSASNPWERVNVSASALSAHSEHGPDIVVVDNDNTFTCPDPDDDPYPVPEMLSVDFDATHENADIDWVGTDDERLDGYKVLMSTTDPHPNYPYPGGGDYIAWITDPNTTETVYNYDYQCGTTYYFSVTSLYDGHNEPDQFVDAPEAIAASFDCAEPEPSCDGADAEFVVDLAVMGLNCGEQNLPAYDSESINLSTGAGNYDVYTVAHRDGLNEDPIYGQDHEEFTISVNGSSEGPVVLDQPDGMVWNIQNAGTFAFVDGANTVEMDTAFECQDPNSLDRNSVAVTKLCLYKNEDPEPQTATVIANKIVCDEETDLPNWSGGADITADTAQNYVDTHASCHFAPNWKFEWGTNDSLLSLNGDYVGEHNVNGWYDFDSLTDTNGQAQVELNLDELSGKTWFREVLQNDYIPYSFPPGEKTDDVSAEFWCNNDVVNYDNAEWIENMEAGNTYYCVAFNVQTPTQAECGNYQLEDGEECDDGPNGSDSCTSECTLIQPEEECTIANSLITNGSFEEPTNSSLWQKRSSVPGWLIEKVSDNSLTTLELQKGWSGNVAAEGLQYSELDGDHSTRITQNVVTEVGAQYKLFWSFAARHNISADQNHLGVNVDGAQVATNGPLTGTAPLAQEDWLNSNYTFTASSTDTAISFEDLGPSNTFGTFLDDVRLCKIADAEPSDNIPVITLIGDPIVNVENGSVYTDEGATADDEEDGDITGDIVTVNPVDTSVAGTYTITYNVTDSDGNHAVEVTRTVIVGAPHAPWCSALLGALKAYYNPDSSAYGLYNDVIDLSNDHAINLTDVSMLTSMYFAGDDDVCYAQFENLTSETREFYFQCEDSNVGWCSGLIQGVTDFNGQNYINNDFSPRYDLNGDGVVNLIDVVAVAQLNAANDQVSCYTYYVPPFLMCEDPKPYCGDGIVNQETEQCDDGNTESGDGCSASCQNEGGGSDPYCGDGIVNQETEQCDGDEPQSCITEDGYAGIQSCNMPSDVQTLQSEEPTYCVWNSCLTDEYCGDGIQNGTEECDNGPDGSESCTAKCEIIPEPPCVGNCGGGGGGGTTFSIRDLSSNVSCQGFNISWRTTKSSDTILDLGTESGVYTQNIDDKVNSLSHSVALPGLLPDTTYYYKVRAKANSNGLEITAAEKSFTTPPAEQCEEVLGEKIVNPEPQKPLICDFLRASGSSGVDKDVEGVFQYPDGTLLRDACDHREDVYLIRDQKKWHVPNWQYLHDYHFGQRIYNVYTTVLKNYQDWTGQVLGIKEYADGTLLRGADTKIYVLQKGHKQHILNLEELSKYVGRPIINVSDEVLDRY